MSLLSEKLAPIWSAINRLQARQMSIFPATVTSVDPVRIRIDGESQSLAASPDNGLPVGQGDRVRVLRYGTSHLIVARINTAGMPWREAADAVSVTGSNEAVASLAVTYPPGRFTLPPIVTLEAHSIAYGATASNRTASGFTLNVRRYDAAPFAGSVPVHWRATQASPTSAGG